ncbi:hypothetical protein [Mucisphaera sp.]|uniref:hypothetical protein n=1 Tax=Mucisphaera sp. TaxID=2913024 RepID=UPI003D0C35E1
MIHRFSGAPRTGLRNRRLHHPLTAACLWLLALATAPLASAQTGTAEPVLTLDWRGLLEAPGVLEPSIDDPVWSLEPRPGRQQVMIPLTVTAGTDPAGEPVELRTPEMGLRSAQFLGWYIPPADLSQDGSVSDTGRQAGGIGGLGGLGAVGGLGGGPAGGFGATNAGLTGAGASDAEASQSPRLAKSITLDPSGRVTWGMDRVIVGAAIGSGGAGGNPYILKLDPAAMRELRPTPPDRSRGNTDRNAQREALATFRAANAEYNELRKQVRDLPETFEATPERVWAVYSLSEREDTLEFTNPLGGGEASTWTLTIADLAELRSRVGASRGGGGQEPADGNLGARLAMSGHPLGLRVFALAEVQRGALANLDESNVMMQRGVEQLLNSPDEPTRAIIVQALADKEVIGPASMRLLEQASHDPAADIRLIAMTGLLRGDAGDERLATAIADILRSGEIPATEVLERVAAQADPVLSGQARTRGDDETDPVAAWTTLVDGLPIVEVAMRDEAVVSQVIALSSTSPAARRWLERGLLLSDDPVLLDRVFAGLASWPEDRERLVLEDVTHPLIERLAVSPSDEAWAGLWAYRPNGESNRSGGRAGQPVGVMGGLGGGIGGGIAATQTTDPETAMDRVIRLAVAEDPTPGAAVAFIERAGREEAVGRGRLILAGLGRGEAATLAGQRLLASDVSLGSVLNELPAERRGVLVSGWYASLGLEAPAAVMLLSGESSGRGGGDLQRWFVERVDAGVLPDGAAWSAAFTSDEPLLAYTVSENPDVAEAAWVTLVERFGGDVSLGEQLTDEAAAEGITEVRAATVFWERTRARLNAEQIAEQSGSYRLEVERIGRDLSESQIAQLGLIELYEQSGRLRVRGDGLSIEPGEASMTIVLRNPNALETMAPDGPTVLAGVDWPRTLLLESREGGVWEGTERTGGTTIRVVLTPVGE